MGSLYSKPKMPNPVVYYAPTPAASTPAASTDTAPETDENAERAKVAAAIRRRSLPETILTSFRGVLSQGNWVPQRKSLLGE